MALKWVHLNDVERFCLIKALGKIRKSDVGTARDLREVRQRFGLRDLEREISGLTMALEEFDIAVSWDDMLDGMLPVAQRLERVGVKAVRAENRLNEIRAALRSFSTEPEKYSIDDSYLNWLLEDVFKGLSWGEVMIRNPMGETKRAEIPIPSGLLEAYANLVDKVSAAYSSPPIKELRDGKPAEES